jgi:plastocyanin
MAASVRIINFAFSPSALSVRAGTRVTFTNDDMATHTVTADSGLFNSGNLSTGQSFSFTFTSRGSFAYHCRIHPSMTGTVSVTS